MASLAPVGQPPAADAKHKAFDTAENMRPTNLPRAPLPEAGNHSPALPLNRYSHQQ